MAMFSLLRNHRSYAFASSFKLKRSVLPLSYVATRHFLTTSSDHSPAQKAGKVASPNPSTTKPKSESKPDIKSEKKPAALKKQDKPKKSKHINKRYI
ncbi:hypothetical protein BYT27DRAFT_6446977 [Phlegmacium glaucopus]|nr:hypothetical protein BYT27DRAFT_6446977 [Phlegmacium glaucopus]